jgi:site-specific recombinase XerD
LVEADVHLEQVRQVMGHTKIQTTQRYVHLSDHQTARVVEVLNQRHPPTEVPTESTVP